MFRDVDALGPGVDFDQEIEESIGSADVAPGGLAGAALVILGGYLGLRGTRRAVAAAYAAT